VSRQDLRGTIQQLIDLCEGASVQSSEVEQELVRLLDRLALASHDAAPDESGRDADTPRREYPEVRATVAQRFPSFGLYRSGGTDLDEESLVGDAIDDLSDILIDLSEVAWLWNNVGELEARWQFHFGFVRHWGSHLRSLQWYLHEAVRADEADGPTGPP